ncbi:yeats family-domain-containing protein, partial [Blyttiomyces helicus]
QGVSVSRPIVYGTTAVPLSKKDPRSDESHTHRWAVYVRGLNGDNVGLYIKRVQFKLHESFAQATRTIEHPPFEVTETGWGEFEITIKIFFHDAGERAITVYHPLQLYPKDDAGNTQSKRAIVSENYDEIVFNEPTEEMYHIL